MKTPSVIRVEPRDRFHMRYYRRRLEPPGEVTFRLRSRFYFCPVCSRKTLVRYGWFNPFQPGPSPFPADLKRVFDRVKNSDHEAILDFLCRGCGRPVRLLFWMQEVGMGGPWMFLVKGVLEVDDAGV